MHVDYFNVWKLHRTETAVSCTCHLSVNPYCYKGFLNLKRVVGKGGWSAKDETMGPRRKMKHDISRELWNNPNEPADNCGLTTTGKLPNPTGLRHYSLQERYPSRVVRHRTCTPSTRRAP